MKVKIKNKIHRYDIRDLALVMDTNILYIKSVSV